MYEGSAKTWAENEFGTTALGDIWRTRRLVSMAAGAARRPSGKISAVFDKTHDREGAYDSLENSSIAADVVAQSYFASTVERAHRESKALVYVVIDGSSINLTDARSEKDFGPIGSGNRPSRGLKVMNALAVSRDGVPLGLVDQLFWARPPHKKLTRAAAAKRNASLPFADKEPAYFVRATVNAVERLRSAGVHAWAIIDREADNRGILLGLAKAKCLFTVRSHWDRHTVEEKLPLREVLGQQPRLGSHEVDIGRTGRRAARRATIEVRAKLVTLRFSKRKNQPLETLTVTAVWFRELNAEDGEPLDWLLLTNVPVTNAEQAREIVDSYRVRWRIEEFHRTWKQGECNVEDAQLRSKEAVVKWATILAAVATRIERLKYLSRNKPDQPASTELAPLEIEALKLDQRQRRPGSKKRKLPDMPTICEATHWIAELGGWIGIANGPPGASTIARGLERLAYFTEAITLARQPSRGGGRT